MQKFDFLLLDYLIKFGSISNFVGMIFKSLGKTFKIREE